jgi:hypothetical protein
VQVGELNYQEKSWRECRRYIQLLRSFFGPEPPGCQLKIKTQQHEFGEYMEVICEYSDDAGLQYALKCEGEGPETWTGVDSFSEHLQQD